MALLEALGTHVFFIVTPLVAQPDLLFLPGILFYFLLWLIPLSLAAVLISLGRWGGGRLRRGIVNALALAVLFVFNLAHWASWYLFAKMGNFLSVPLVKFAISNAVSLNWHFLQMFRLYFAVYVVLLAVASFLMFLVVTRPPTDRFRYYRAVVAASLLFAVAGSAAYVAVSPDTRTRTHPFVAYVASSVDYFGLDIRSRSKFSAVLTGHSEAKHRAALMGLKERMAADVPAKKYSVDHPVIFILVEAMRRDLIFLEPSPVPFMRSLVPESIFFDKAYASSSHSNYADISVWYSQYPLRAGYMYEYTADSPWRMTSIFKVFKDLGYSTGYISSQNEKWGGMHHWLKVPEVDFFFHSEDFHGETWLDTHPESLPKLIRSKITTSGKIEDSETIKIAEAWLDKLGTRKKFFLGMNLQNTHFNYVIPKGGLEPFQPAMDFAGCFGGWPKEMAPQVKNRYYNSFLNVDRIVQGFAEFLKERGIWDDCFFILLGDNGEAFYEHGFANHSAPMYDEVSRTFCIIKPPKQLAPQRVEAPVSHIDIVCSVLDMMGVEQPPAFQGVSPFGENPRQNVYIHSIGFAGEDGIVSWPWKLLVRREGDTCELFNLDSDPAEKTDVFVKHKDVALGLKERLDVWRRNQLDYYGNQDLYRYYYPPMSR